MDPQPDPVGNKVDLVSPWPLERCQAALAAAMDGSLLGRGEEPVIGSVHGTRLRARKRIGYRNSFQTILRADLSERAGQTYIGCRMGMSSAVKGFMVFWLGGVLGIGAGFTASSLPDLFRDGLAASPGTWLGALQPAGMAVFGAGLVWFGRRIARSERRFLLDFLRETVQAAPTGPRP